MAQLGVYSTQGLARGLTDGLPHVDRALGAVTGQMAAARPVIGRGTVNQRSGGNTVININVTGAEDPAATARAVRRELLSLKRQYGGALLNIS